jgi:hypothetical protein
MRTFLRIFFLIILLGGIVVGIILVGQKQLLEKEAAEISSALSNLRPSLAPSPTPGPDAASVKFKVRFQGVVGSVTGKGVSLILRQGEVAVYSFTNISVSASSGGVYLGRVEGVNPGVYDFYVKGEAHLIRKFPELIVETGENSFDFSQELLLAGDFDGNNKINVNDVGVLSSKITLPAQVVDASSQIFDLDGNGKIGPSDMDLLLSNYQGLEVAGE